MVGGKMKGDGMLINDGVMKVDGMKP